MLITNSKDTIGNWTRDLSTCNAVPHPTVPNPAPIIYRNSLCIIYYGVQAGSGPQPVSYSARRNASSCTSTPPTRLQGLVLNEALVFSSLLFMSLLPVPHDYPHNTAKLKWSRYRTGVAQTVGRGIALLFHDRGTRRGWVVSPTPRPHFTPGKDQLPILQEAGWAPGLVWTGGKSRPHQDSIPDRPARSQSLYRRSYPAHSIQIISGENVMDKLVA